MNQPRRPSPFPLLPSYSFLISLSLLFFTISCATATTIVTSTDPQPGVGFVLVTPNSQPTVTPFQAPLITALPPITSEPPATLTPLPTALPTDIPVPTDAPTGSTPPTELPTDTSASPPVAGDKPQYALNVRSEEHTSELQSLTNLVCRLLLEKKQRRAGPRPGRTTCPL